MARHRTRCLICSTSFNSPRFPITFIWLWENWGFRRLENLPNVTWLGSDRCRNWMNIYLHFPLPAFNYCALLPNPLSSWPLAAKEASRDRPSIEISFWPAQKPNVSSSLEVWNPNCEESQWVYMAVGTRFEAAICIHLALSRCHLSWHVHSLHQEWFWAKFFNPLCFSRAFCLTP